MVTTETRNYSCFHRINYCLISFYNLQVLLGRFEYSFCSCHNDRFILSIKVISSYSVIDLYSTSPSCFKRISTDVFDTPRKFLMLFISCLPSPSKLSLPYTIRVCVDPNLNKHSSTSLLAIHSNLFLAVEY